MLDDISFRSEQKNNGIGGVTEKERRRGEMKGKKESREIIPKSATFTTKLASTNRFSGFKSKCRMGGSEQCSLITN